MDFATYLNDKPVNLINDVRLLVTGIKSNRFRNMLYSIIKFITNYSVTHRGTPRAKCDYTFLKLLDPVQN
jgi:hypothetical protein